MIKGLRSMADTGVMIELRVDTDRIKRLAPLYQETILAGEQQRAGIVAPKEGQFRRTAGRVQEQLARRTGAELPLLDEASFANAEELSGNIIAIGHVANNQLLRRLHHLGYLANRDYPSEGLRVVSVHNPLGHGHNVLAALGYTPQVAERSLERLLERLVARDGQWLAEGRILEIEPRPETPDPDDLLAEARARGKESWVGRPSSFLTALDHLNAAGEERWARAFVELITPYATGEIPLSFWLMSAVDFWTDRLVTGWDIAEEFPYFSDDERLLIANFIASCTQYCHDSITYQKWRITQEEHQVFNHYTFPAKGLFFGCMYLRRHGYEVVDIDAWLEKSLHVFARAAQAGRSFDEGGAGYSWLVGNHLLEVSLARGDTGYAASEKLVHYADLAVAIQNNHFETVPFGDCGGYHSRGGGAANILLRAAEWHKDRGYKWVAEQTGPQEAEADVLAREVPGEPPAKHLGLFVLPLDPVIRRWAGLPFFPNYPPPLAAPNVPARQCFDKLSLRGGWDEDDDYLLLQGFGSGSHGHPDANAISQYQARGRLFLVDCDYIRRMPKQHNMVMIIRDGEHAPIPVTARLDCTEEFSGGAMTQTTLVDYNGCDWTRTLLWLAGDFVLAIDSLRAKVAGEYELRCYWRTLGAASLTERGMNANHDDEHFHVIELTDSERRLDVEPIPLNAADYPEYKFGAPSPKVLCEKRKLQLDGGEEVCFVNLLLPNGRAKAPRRAIEWAGPGLMRISGEGPTVTVNAEGFEIEGGVSYTFSESNRLTGLEARPSHASAPAVHLPASVGTERWRVPLPAAATCLNGTEDGGALVGCEDGSVVKVDQAGELRLLTRAEAGIGAVLAGRLFGEAEVTYMTAGFDGKLRFLTPDGGQRMVVDLPGGTHLPGWGRALCLADLDGDGKLWPIVGTAAWRVHAIGPDGAVRWTFDTAAHSVTCLAAGDLNGDGRDEVAAGTVYFCVPAATADGQRLWQDEEYNDYWRGGPHFTDIHIADVDADGQLEVITAASDTLVHCISHLGEKKWTLSIGDDPAGLVLISRGIAAASRTGDLHLIDGQGNRLWRLSLNTVHLGWYVVYFWRR